VLLEEKNFDVLCLSETCISHANEVPSFPGYLLYCSQLKVKDRGVAMLIRSGIKVNKVDIQFEFLSSNIEIIVMKLQVKFHKSFLVSCLYRHPDYSSHSLTVDYRALSDYFNALKEYNLAFYVLGDFNFRDQYINPLLSNLNHLNLIQLVEVPTRNEKLLDLIIVNSPSHIMSVDVYDASIADHLLVECQIKVRKPKPIKKLYSSGHLRRFVWKRYWSTLIM
jgi:exonuclease III